MSEHEAPPPLSPLETAILQAIQVEPYYANSVADLVACGWLRKLGLCERVEVESQTRFGITPAGQALADELGLTRPGE